MTPRIEIFFIVVITFLLFFFLSLYFYKNLNLLKKDNITDDALDNNNDHDKNIVAEWTEQFHIISAQLDLMFQLSPVFIACFDFARNYFSLSENGYEQLNLNNFDVDSKHEISQTMFEELIHIDDLSLYEEIKSCEDIRLFEISGSPYVLRLKKGLSSDSYSQYFIRVKPIYDINGNSIALILAFVNAEI